MWLMTLLPLASPRHPMSGGGWMQQNSVHDDIVPWGKLHHGGELCRSVLWKRKNDNFHSLTNIFQEAKIAMLSSWASAVWWLKWYNGALKTITTVILSYFMRDFLFRKVCPKLVSEVTLSTPPKLWIKSRDQNWKHFLAFLPVGRQSSHSKPMYILPE